MKQLKFYTALVLFILLLNNYSFSQKLFENHFDNSALRIEFLHTGDLKQEKIEITSLLKVPYYAGPKRMDNPLKDFGCRRVLILDLNRDTLFIKGYSSLFTEWRMTAEAEKTVKSFEQSLILPLPKSVFILVIEARIPGDGFNPISEIRINPDTLHEDLQKGKYKFTYIKKRGEPEKMVDVLIIPEGYHSSETAKLVKDVKRVASYLDDYKPYNSFKRHFNILYLEVYSEESGISKPEQNLKRNSILQTYYGILGINRYLMTERIWTLYRIASNAPFDQIVILVNDSEYGGGGIYNLCSVCSADNQNSRFLLHHEFAHSFAGLADEYCAEAIHACLYSSDYEPWQPNITTLHDFDSKWKNLVTPGIDVPTPRSQYNDHVVGAFEGAAFCKVGVYRSQLDCTMRSVIENRFCVVCKEIIIKTIKYYSY